MGMWKGGGRGCRDEVERYRWDVSERVDEEVEQEGGGGDWVDR